MKIIVCVGTGGVGKTTVATALALQAAKSGKKSLVLTIDPARRLRTILRLDSVKGEHQVPLDVKGELWAGILDVETTLERAVQHYGTGKQIKTVLNHPIYAMLVSSLSGMQELMAVECLDQAIQRGFQTIVVDTAPSRHAFEFLDKPEFFADLVSLPLVRLVGRTYRIWERLPVVQLSRKSLELYSRLEYLVGAGVIKQILDFYSVFRTIAESYAESARKSTSLLRDAGNSEFCVITVPAKARQDADFFYRELSKRKFHVGSVVLNRVWPREMDFSDNEDSNLSDIVEWYDEISRGHLEAWNAVHQHFGDRIPKIIRLRELAQTIDGLPAVERLCADLGVD